MRVLPEILVVQPVPLALTLFKPAGRVSLTVMSWFAGTGPAEARLLTINVDVTVCPTCEQVLFGWVRLKVRSGGLLIVSVSVLVLLDGLLSSGVVTVALLASAGAAALVSVPLIVIGARLAPGMTG